MRNIRLLIEYEGTDFHGWQKQPDQRTVQGVIEEVLERLLGHKVRLIGASRTDSGVHALGQVANFKTTSKFPLPELKRALNALLPEDVVILEAEEAPLDFHARFWAKSKVYEYKIFQRGTRSPFVRRYYWHLPEELDLERMEKCCKLILGTHDFSSFRLSGSDSKNPIRDMLRAEVHRRTPQEVVFIFEATGFLRGMVRSLVGTLVDVGRGKLTLEQFKEILDARDRSKASPTAPPQGLYLVEVKY